MSMPNLTAVVAADLCDVTDRLPLLFVLVERAVAEVHAELIRPRTRPAASTRPLMKNAGRPEVNVVSMFRPGMPASLAGVVP